MKSWVGLVIGGILLAWTGPALSAQAESPAVTLTIDRAISQALANQPLIQQAQAAVEAARARVGQANSSYYPFVSGSGSYDRLSDQSFAISSVLPPALLQGATIPSNIAPLLNEPFSLVPVNVWDFHVGLNQVIFQFGKRGVQVKLAESGVSAAQIGVEQIRLSLAFQAAQGFYSVLFLRDQVSAVNEQQANLQEHLAATRAKAQAGTATKYDELATEVRISTLQSQLIDAQNQLEKQTIAFKQLLGIPESTGWTCRVSSRRRLMRLHRRLPPRTPPQPSRPCLIPPWRGGPRSGKRRKGKGRRSLPGGLPPWGVGQRSPGMRLWATRTAFSRISTHRRSTGLRAFR